jgi:hypothetical protein
VTDGADVDMRLIALEFLLRHSLRLPFESCVLSDLVA